MKRICCICEKVIEPTEQNNPAPVGDSITEVCCTECNYKIVLPARSIISMLIKAKKNCEKLRVITVPDYSLMFEFYQQVQSGQFTPVLGETYTYDSSKGALKKQTK